MYPQALATVATLLSFAAHGDRIELKPDHGSAEIIWLTERSFRFRRSLEGPLAAVPPGIHPQVAVEIDDTPGVLRLHTKFLEVAIDKHGLLVHVRRADGVPLASDVSEPKADGPTVTWERETPAGSRIYGLGRRAEMGFDLRGKSVRAEVPLLISTAGYGEYYHGNGQFSFEITAEGRYRIQVPQVDYYFYFGPSPKEIFQARKNDPTIAFLPDTPARASSDPPSSSLAPGTWDTLRTSILRGVQGAMSGDISPSFDLSIYNSAPAELQQRARQVGSLVRNVVPGSLGLSPFRQQLQSFLEMYDVEVRDHNHPTWHPLPFQFPDDPECALHADEFMLGDELLIAPIYQPGNKRDVYLPNGIWTNLATNEVFNGHRTISIESAPLPVFAHNGTIVPLNSAGGLGLHYFPKLGGEFFLHETDTDEYTQIHAAPAGDEMRLEIESKKDRDYQWVVHHVERPTGVGFEDKKYGAAESMQRLTDRTWFYDSASKNLIIRVKVKAGEDAIINLAW